MKSHTSLVAQQTRLTFTLDLYDKNTLFLFCDKRTDWIKGLIWEGDGFLFLICAKRRK